MKFTILGGQGFIGRHLAAHLKSSGHDIHVFGREELRSNHTALGNVIYAIGLTGDFRKRPFDAVEAHVCQLSRIISSVCFDSFLYLSSARVYSGISCADGGRETTPIPILPTPDRLYDLSKMLGEAICLSQPRSAIRVVRLSNVYGPGQSRSTFLGALVHELVHKSHAVIGELPQSSKDYISIQDVCPLLEHIAIEGRHRLYNVASGRKTTHAEIAAGLSRLGAGTVEFSELGAERVFPTIDTALLRSEFDFRARDVVADLDELVKAERAEQEVK